MKNVKSRVTARKIEQVIKGVEASGKTVVRVIVEGSRIEVVTSDEVNLDVSEPNTCDAAFGIDTSDDTRRPKQW